MHTIIETLAYSNDNNVMRLYRAFVSQQTTSDELAELDNELLEDEAAVEAARAVLVELSKQPTTANQLQNIIDERSTNETFAGPITLILGVGGLIAVLQVLDSVKVEYKRGADGKSTLDIKYEPSGRIVEMIKSIAELVGKLGVKVQIEQITNSNN